MSGRVNTFPNFNPRLQNDFQHRIRSTPDISHHQLSKSQASQDGAKFIPFALNDSQNAEEIGMLTGADRIAASKSKSLKRRSIGTENIDHLGDKSERNQRINDIQKLRKIYEQLDNSYNPNHLEKHAKHLYQLAAKGESFSFTDASLPAASYIQLKSAEDMANKIKNDFRSSDKEKSNAANALENIGKKLKALDEDENFSRKIDAGLNTAEIFSEAFQNNTDRASARKFYYDNIMGAADIGAMLQALGNSLGWEKLSHSIDTMQGAILRDMNASKGSTDFKQLATKMKDLQRINEIRSVDSDCAEFRSNMINQGIMKHNMDETPLDLMKEILALGSGSIFANDIERIANKYAGSDPSNKLTFMNSFYSFLKSLPQGIWTNEKNRLTGLQTILVHLENEALKLHKDQSNNFKV